MRTFARTGTRVTRGTKGVLLVICALALVGTRPAPAAGQGDDRARLSRLQGEIAQLAAERQRLASEERGILGRIDTLAAEARLLDAQLERYAIEQRDLEAALSGMGRRREVVEAQLTEARLRLLRTVRLLYEAGPLGTMRFAIEGRDTTDLAAGWRLSHELSARQRDELLRVRAAQDELARIGRDGEAKRAELAQLSGQTRVARGQLAAAMRERRALLVQVREQASQRDQAVDELERASRELGEILSGQAAPRNVTLDVHRFRGLLPMPASGNVVRGYGDRRDPRFGTVLPHRGWDIDAPYGSEVRAIFDGKVVWASWFRGYGLMVVLDHGHGVHSVYAHLSVITAANGSEIQKGQVIGRVGDTGSLGGPELYVEIRAAGKAEDPALWIRRKPT